MLNNSNISIDTKTLIIVALVVALFFSLDGCSKIAGIAGGYDVIKETERTRVETVIEHRTSETNNDSINQEKPNKETQKVIFNKGKIRKVDSAYHMTETEQSSGAQELYLNKYKAISIVPNGRIESEILTTGELYGTQFKLTTSDTTTTRTINKERTVALSGLYGVGGTTIGLDGRIKDVQAGVEYVYKARWFLGAGLQYDVDPKIDLPVSDRAGITLRFGVRF